MSGAAISLSRNAIAPSITRQRDWNGAMLKKKMQKKKKKKAEATDDGTKGSVKASPVLLSRGMRGGWISLKDGRGWLQCGDGGWTTKENEGGGRFCGSLSPPSASSSPLGPRCLNHFIFLSSPHSLLYKFSDYGRPLRLRLHYSFYKFCH